MHGCLAFAGDSLLALAICNDFVCLKENEKNTRILFVFFCVVVRCGVVRYRMVGSVHRVNHPISRILSMARHVLTEI